MSSRSKKSNGDVDTTDGKRTTSTKTNVRSLRSERSKKLSKTKSIIEYTKNTGMHGVSLDTHVRVLIELFVFQNPIQPIRHFEYYSEKIKERYRRPRHSDVDSDFLNNIELEVCKKITNIRNNKIHAEEVRPSYVYGDEGDNRAEVDGDAYLDDENEEDDDDYYQSDGESNGVAATQDISQINRAFNKAGCGMTDDEAYLIETTMNHLSNDAKFRNVRYWGKMLGLKRNYYVLECQWRNKEIEYKLRARNNLMKNATFGNGNEYEDEGPLGETGNETFFNEQSDDENTNVPNSIPSLPNDNVAEQIARDSETFGCDESKSTCFPSSAEPAADQFYSEMFGFGANKKSYFVTNEPYGEWIELPLLMPHHVIQSRDIKRYLVGDLESPVECFPPFQGAEKHYLRAQIARITAETQISPRGYFSPGGQQTVRTNGLTPFQSKVLSRTHVHDYVMNENYDPPSSAHALLKPNNWVHHTPPISDRGVTDEWIEIITSEKHDGKEEEQEETAEDREPTTAGLVFATVADDPCTVVDRGPPWTFRLTNPFDRRAAYVYAASNVWPGAFALAGNRLSDCTYCGWGHGPDAANGFACLTEPGDAYRSEGPSADARNTVEAKDPTPAEQQSFVDRLHMTREEERLRNKDAGIAPRDEDYEDEERVLAKYNYD